MKQRRRFIRRIRLFSFILGSAAIANLLFLGGNGRINNKDNHKPLAASFLQESAQVSHQYYHGSQQQQGRSIIDADTTIIVTSSFIPSLPSTELIDETIESLHYLEGLRLQSTPIIITIDGAYNKDRGPNAPRTKVLQEYKQKLQQKYLARDVPHNNITILTSETNIKLVGNVQKAMDIVNTEFVYLVQHDMPFIAPINHTGLVATFHNHPDDQVRLVRFSPRKTLTRHRDHILGVCEEDEIMFHDVASNIHLSKTHTWSDNNHFTRKSYYEEIFTTIDGWDNTRYMEEKMKVMGIDNCSYWGTYLYGAIGDRPTILHRDGRRKYGIVESSAS